VASGIFVVSIEAGSPAQRAGVREGDIIVGLGGRPIGDIDTLHRELTEWQVGAETFLIVLRETEKLSLAITPADIP
jgi:S1-C subfamily serine protease